MLMNKFLVDIRNQETTLKSLDGKIWKHWAGFPPWQHVARQRQSSSLSRWGLGSPAHSNLLPARFLRVL